MSSFFHSITRYFDKGYHGQYLSIVLLELARNEPKSFARLLTTPNTASDAEVLNFWKKQSEELELFKLSAEREYPFDGKRQARRADIALIFDKHAAVLVEVKEFDGKKSDHNDGQMADYLRMVKKGVGFIYIYRFLPERGIENSLRQMQADGHPVLLLSYDAIYSELAALDSKQAPVARLVCSYMEDIGVGIYKTLDLRRGDKSATLFLLSQMLGLPHASGLGKNQSDASVRKGADILKQMYANIEVLAEWTRSYNTEVIPLKSSRRFWVEQKFDIEKLRKAISDVSKASKKKQGLELPNAVWSYVRGGTVYFEATCGVRTSGTMKANRLTLKIGIAMGLNQGDAKVKTYLYTHFESAALPKNQVGDQTMASSQYLGYFPSEDKARELIASLLSSSLDMAKAMKLPSFRYLDSFKIPRIN